MPDTRTRPDDTRLPRPHVKPFPLALAAALLDGADLVPALWDASHDRLIGRPSRDARLAATWAGLFFEEQGPSTRRSPALPTGVLPQFARLEREGLIRELGAPDEAPSYGVSRSDWDLLFVSAINRKTVSALRQVMMLGWAEGAEPVPLSEVTRSVPPVRVDGGPGRVRVPHELVLAGMHLSGFRVDLSGGREPLIHVEVPTPGYRRSGPEGPVPSLFDGGWLTPIPEGATTDLDAEDRMSRKTDMVHLFRAASLIREAGRSPAFIPELGLDLHVLEDASGLSNLFSERASELRSRTQRGEARFTDLLTPLARSWLSPLDAQSAVMCGPNGSGPWPADPEEREAQTLLLLAQEGFRAARASSPAQALIRPDAFRDLIRDHADPEGKAEIDDLLQLRGGVLNNPVARFWQSLCLRMPDRTVSQMGAEPAPDADPRMNAIRIGDLLLVAQRKPLLQLLSEAERGGCRGVMNLSETASDTPVDLFQIEVRDQEVLARGVFDRAPSDPAHRAEPRLKRRARVLGDSGLGQTEEAIRALNRSSLPVRKPRHYQVAHDYLAGTEASEIAEELGISRGRVNQMIQTAVRIVSQERGADAGPTAVLNGLSSRSQNALRHRSFGTDEGVRALLGKYGSAALLALPNLGKDSQAEICEAFGFDPDEQLRLPGFERGEADRLRPVPSLARDRRAREERLLEIFEADPKVRRAAARPTRADHQPPEEIEQMSSWEHPYN